MQNMINKREMGNGHMEGKRVRGEKERREEGGGREEKLINYNNIEEQY